MGGSSGQRWQTSDWLLTLPSSNVLHFYVRHEQLDDCQLVRDSQFPLGFIEFVSSCILNTEVKCAERRKCSIASVSYKVLAKGLVFNGADFGWNGPSNICDLVHGNDTSTALDKNQLPYFY